MIDKDYRNHRIRDLAERLFFAGASNGARIVVEEAYQWAETMIDLGIKNYPTTDDECEDEPSSPPVQDSL